jgi:hypothetical protein
VADESYVNFNRPGSGRWKLTVNPGCAPDMVYPGHTPNANPTKTYGVFGLAFKVLLLLKKAKAKPNSPAFS